MKKREGMRDHHRHIELDTSDHQLTLEDIEEKELT
jgi:hypothetical protein